MAAADLIGKEWSKHAARVERISQKHRGDLLRITHGPGKSRPSGQLLVLGHYDTVLLDRNTRQNAVRVRGGKAYGPGTFDMKAGIVQALFALQALQHLRVQLPTNAWSSFGLPMRRIGSESSRKYFEAEARRSDAVLSWSLPLARAGS